MTKKAIILYWLLLFIPTLLIGAAAFRLLSHEQARIDREFRASARDRVSSLAERIHLSVIAVEEGIIDALGRIQEEEIAETLFRWERQNPLIRNVFLWEPRAGLLMPDPKRPATEEERRFIARYEGLFSGRIPWSDFSNRNEARNPKFDSNYQQSGGRSQLRQLARLKPPEGKKTTNKPSHAEPSGASGWLPWFSENRLYLLGWLQEHQTKPVRGVEIEMMALLSRVQADMPREAPEGVIYALLDGNGQMLFQSGSDIVDEGVKPDVFVSLAPYLPHWQVAAYFVGNSLSGAGRRGFILLSGLLLAIFLAAIILGGFLLLWQAHRNMRDARQKTSFVSNVSHELKTPLTSIRMYAELLAEGRIRDTRKRRDYLDVIVTESQRLTRLVNNVLDFSRLEQGRKQYNVEGLDICHCVREVVETQRPRLQRVGIELRLKIPDASVIIPMDRDALEQVILNLLDNAVKYGSASPPPAIPNDADRKPGTISARPAEVVVEIRTESTRTEIRVMDRGPGVPHAHRTRIFEKFHRIDDSLTARQPGAGLGLSIARQLLRDLGGDLTYLPREGGGSCFVVTLPGGNDHAEDSYPDRRG